MVGLAPHSFEIYRMNEAQQPGIRIEQILLERAEFGHRADFLEYPPSTPVELNLKVSFSPGMTADGQRAIVRALVETVQNDQLYSLAFQMTALVESEANAANYPLSDYIVTNAQAMLFPFLREVVANVTARGRFGPVWLKPLNIIAVQKENQPQIAESSQG
jgi:preprotein translocase subunit SecB